ncbi:hypothetical protein QEH52_04325 [Coraliomargarita sp. SDUM461003]|uniref:Uncharacterized protein n=1 Tax=Thalassobacterium maritimum TaxID=3041265 RepID=A0ABU1AUT5_9BACT|nr:hypothetical protein [Coraliomargarita sp. SDUM461003]MDQ8206722.1 hypothetical protein [Coraliomargarita sp. SDUM461003]
MKFCSGLSLGCVLTACLVGLLGAKWNQRQIEQIESQLLELQQPNQSYQIYSHLDHSIELRERILVTEQSFMQQFIPEDQQKCYLTYFTRGLDSSGGVVAAKNRWDPTLELAYQRGFKMKQLFSDGFRAGLWKSQSLLGFTQQPAAEASE